MKIPVPTKRQAAFPYIFALAATLFSAPAVFGDSVAIDIDMGATPSEISPLIYGLNDWSRNDTTESLAYTLERMGGNRMTSYNWENNFSNAGKDYIHHSDNSIVNTIPLAEQSIPGKGVMLSVDHARLGNRPSLVTLQLAGYVAADGDGTVTEAQVAPSTRWKEVKITKGSTLSTTPDTTDDYVYMDEQVNFLIQTYGTAAQGGVFAYSLDNEPALWTNTHPRIHPVQPTATEIIQNGADTAAMVKSLDPDALVFGPALWGWGGYVNFQSATDWSTYSSSYDWFISAYLGEMKKAGDTAGKRLLDVLDIHYYPEATWQNTSGDYIRVTDSTNDSEGLTEERLQAPRSLWDSTYTESSWVTSSINAPINLLPKVKTSITNNYPGTKLAITEYDFGGHQNFSGALVQADVLGIFGRDGVYAACYWGSVENYIIPAFGLYLNYDGNGGKFGDLSIPASNPDAAVFSTYASIDSETGQTHLIVINKSSSAEAVTITLKDATSIAERVQVYAITENTGATIIDAETKEDIVANSFEASLPAHSAVHLVITSAEPESDLTIFQGSSNDSVILLFKTESGVNYQLQSSPDMATWTNVGETLSGDGYLQRSDQTISDTTRPIFWRYIAL